MSFGILNRTSFGICRKAVFPVCGGVGWLWRGGAVCGCVVLLPNRKRATVDPRLFGWAVSVD
jgi:hypothetical protein